MYIGAAMGSGAIQRSGERLTERGGGQILSDGGEVNHANERAQVC